MIFSSELSAKEMTAEESAKAYLPILVTAVGIVTEFKPLQS